MSVLGQLLALDFSTRRVIRVLLGVGVLVAACARAGVQWTPARIVVVLVAPVSDGRPLVPRIHSK